MLSVLGDLAYQQDSDAEAATYYEELVSIRRDLGDEDALSVALARLGQIMRRQGDLEKARSLLEESLSLRRKLNDSTGCLEILDFIIDLLQKQGKRPEVVPYCEERVTFCRTQGNKRNLGFALYRLGVNLIRLREFDKAQPAVEESLALSRNLDDQGAVAVLLELLGDIARGKAQQEDQEPDVKGGEDSEET